jgi:F-type H+-transporting ATPase subunit b
MFLLPDGTFWFQLVNFAIFFAILNVVFLRPVGDAIKKRRAHLEEVQSDYERYTKQINEAQADADGRRGAARREADEVIAKARISAETESQQFLEGQTAQAHAITEQSRATVALEVVAAKSREDELSATLAKTLLDRALGGSRS